MTLTATYYGAQSAGGLNQDPNASINYCRPVSVTEEGLAVAIEMAVQGGTFYPTAYLLSDIGGAPGDIIAIFQRLDVATSFSSTVRFVAVPIMAWVPAGNYWIGVQSPPGSGAGQLRYAAGVSGDGNIVDGTLNSVQHEPGSTGTVVSATDRQYSIRLVVLTGADGPPVPPPAGVSNRMGGTGAIRKPPRTSR